MGKSNKMFNKGKNNHRKAKRRGNGKTRPREYKNIPEIKENEELDNFEEEPRKKAQRG